MSDRIALVGKIVEWQRPGMEEHYRLASEGTPHCEGWTQYVSAEPRRVLQDQLNELKELHLLVALDGLIRWRFRVSHALFFDQEVLFQDPAHGTRYDIHALFVYAAAKEFSQGLDPSKWTVWKTGAKFVIPPGKFPDEFPYVLDNS